MIIAQLRRFLHEPVLHKTAMLSNAYYLLKTQWLYRFMFGSIGRHTIIRRPLLIRNPRHIQIADHVFIRDGVRLEVVNERPAIRPLLSIGAHTNIEQNVHIVCHNRILIGSGVSITGHCFIVDVTHPYENTREPMKIGLRILDDDSYVEIGDGAFIGVGSVILPNVRIGRHAVIGANSVVRSDVPDYAVAAGAPATVIRHYDTATDTWLTVATIKKRSGA